MTTPGAARSASVVAASTGPPRSSSASRPCQRSAAISSGRPNAWSRPRWRIAIRSARRPASPRKWVASTTVRPWWVAREPIRSMTSRVAVGSRPEVGSSRKRTSGSWRSARAKARRLRCPVDVPWTCWSARSAIPNCSRSSSARRATHARSRPRMRPVSVRFSRAVRRSSSPACSVSTPVRRRTSSPCVAGSSPSTLARPRSGVRMPLSSRTVVVFPAPLGPSRARTSPGFTSIVSPSRATPLGNERVRSWVSMTGISWQSGRVSPPRAIEGGRAPRSRAPGSGAAPAGRRRRRRRGRGRRRRRRGRRRGGR